LPNQNPPKAEKADVKDGAPPRVGEGEVQPRSDAKPQQPDTGKHHAQDDERPTYKTLWREIRIIDLINCFVGIAMLIVAVSAYRIASDTSDIKGAIGNLADLAVQTKRQADAVSDQLSAVREQVTALKEQAAETKLQTEAISQQTAAIKASSDANIKAANAQQILAEVTARAQRPDVDLTDVDLSGLNNAPDKDGMVAAKLMWHFRNSGGSAFTAKEVKFGVQTGDALPETMPSGQIINGSGIVVINSITSGFSPKDPISLQVPKAQADAVMDGSLKVFFFARFEYWDTSHLEHAKCFGRQFLFKEGSSYFTTPSGGTAYQCDD
jgi:hypothetical protein